MFSSKFNKCFKQKQKNKNSIKYLLEIEYIWSSSEKGQHLSVGRDLYSHDVSLSNRFVAPLKV
jgi:hypothetical protein